MIQDTRKVQTAVLGSSGSTKPIMMPFDRTDAMLLRDRYRNRKFYCGEWLGGCGRELYTRIGPVRVPHFAHNPETSEKQAACRRSSTDERSADHLYIQSELSSWLSLHGQKAQKILLEGTLPREGGTCTGMTIKTSRNGLIAIALKNNIANDADGRWPKKNIKLKQAHGWVDWLFAPDVPMVRHAIRRQGYALLIKCESDGYKRIVKIGTKIGGRVPVWTDLANCKLTAEGIRTPQVEQHLQSKAEVPKVTTKTSSDTDPNATQGDIALVNTWARTGFPLRDDLITVTLERIYSPTSGDGNSWQADARIVSDSVPLPISKARLVIEGKAGDATTGIRYRLAGSTLVSAAAQPAGDILWTLYVQGLTAVQAEETLQGKSSETDVSTAVSKPVPDLQHVQHRERLIKIFTDLGVARQQNNLESWKRLFEEACKLTERLSETDKRWADRKLRRHKQSFRDATEVSEAAIALEEVLSQATAACGSSDWICARRLHGRALELFQRVSIREAGIYQTRLNALKRALDNHSATKSAVRPAKESRTFKPLSHRVREQRRHAQRYISLIQTEITRGGRVSYVSSLCKGLEAVLATVPSGEFAAEALRLAEFKEWLRDNWPDPR